MFEAADEKNGVETRHQTGFAQLRLEAGRLGSGLNLLRWAIILVFVGGMVGSLGQMLLDLMMDLNQTARALIILVLWAPVWTVAPLALMGFLRILRVRDWPVHRWLVVALVSYFAARCVCAPLMSINYVVAEAAGYVGVIQVFDWILTGVEVVLSLAFIVVIFACYFLAGAVDDYLDHSLISRNERRGLLWLGVAVQGLSLAWWAGWAIWDSAAQQAVEYDDITYVIIMAMQLAVGLPALFWFIWLLLSMFRVGKRLKRFVKLNHCPRCGYDLRERVESGCPECGWKRTEADQDASICPPPLPE